MNVNLRMSAGVSITVCVCVCEFLQSALQLFPVSYHTALKVAELCMCVSVCMCAKKSQPLSHFYHTLTTCLSHEEGSWKQGSNK